MASFYTTPGWSDEVLDLYLAEGATPIEGGAPAADWEEQGIEVVRLPFQEAVRRAAGPPGDAKTLVALGLPTASSSPAPGRPTQPPAPTGRPGPPGRQESGRPDPAGPVS